MRIRCTQLPLLLCLLLLPLATSTADASTDQTLGAAYTAILRGDYDAGRAAVARVLESDEDRSAAQQAEQWLEQYHKVVASRQELKAETFAWNVEQARKAQADGQKLFLALSFATQAAAYADDPEAFAQEPWIRELTEQGRAAAREFEQADRWSNALTCYFLLSRLHKDDPEIKELRENAIRHARLEIAYEDEEALQKRTRDVSEDLLRSTVRMIDRMYYEEPDFRRVARGAIDNLLTLCGASKLHEYLDGLANPALREHFERRLRELRADIGLQRDYDYKDVLALYKYVKQANRASVELPANLLVVEFVEGAIGELDDFSGMIWPADAREFDKVMRGGFEGIGIQLSMDERSSRLKVVTPLENSPALEAGLQPDDVIVAVDGEDTAGWTTDDAVQNIMGPRGTEVVLTVQRPATGQQLSFRLVRRRIELITVRGLERLPGSSDEWNYMLDQDTGVAYIRLTNFLPKSETELSRALSAAREQGMKGLVLDVRHNPGGLLDVAIDIVSDFLASGEVVSTRGRFDNEHRQPVSGEARYKDIPLVVLVNEGSASASEILAGALQDHDRAIVLGGRTFGKGSVQHVRGLGSDARLKLTTALYHLPSGRSPHKGPDAEEWGVEPNWELKLTPKEFRKVLERERRSYVIPNQRDEQASKPLSEEEQEKLLEALKAEDDEEDEEPPLLSEEDIKQLEADPHDAPDTDPQLETALLLIRVKLAAHIPWPRDLAAAYGTDKP